MPREDAEGAGDGAGRAADADAGFALAAAEGGERADARGDAAGLVEAAAAELFTTEAAAVSAAGLDSGT